MSFTFSAEAEKIFEMQDALQAARQSFYRGEISLHALQAAAEALLIAKRDAEIKKFGKAKTKVNAAAIASLTR